MKNTEKSLNDIQIEVMKQNIKNSDLPFYLEAEYDELENKTAKLFKTESPTYNELKAYSKYGDEALILKGYL